jgi:hypothetical protein
MLGIEPRIGLRIEVANLIQEKARQMTGFFLFLFGGMIDIRMIDVEGVSQFLLLCF